MNGYISHMNGYISYVDTLNAVEMLKIGFGQRIVRFLKYDTA